MGNPRVTNEASMAENMAGDWSAIVHALRMAGWSKTDAMREADTRIANSSPAVPEPTETPMPNADEHKGES